MHVTFVKKILADGSPCRKCADIEARLRASGLWTRIDAVAVADERDAGSEGWALAHAFDVKLAPFFVVREGDAARVYTIYLQFLREVLEPAASGAA